VKHGAFAGAVEDNFREDRRELPYLWEKTRLLPVR